MPDVSILKQFCKDGHICSECGRIAMCSAGLFSLLLLHVGCSLGWGRYEGLGASVDGPLHKRRLVGEFVL